MNVAELIEALTALVDEDPANGERRVMGVYQPSYPLQENVTSVYDPATAGDREYLRCIKVDCVGCSEVVTEAWVTWDGEGDPEYVCKACNDADTDGTPAPVYLTITGTPHDMSPYAPRGVFSSGW